ncbi:hypothetical protein MTP06_24280 [Streptomyces sp. PLM4]|nr:hypothetical protein MTP06_24280 [Streptomyces sp. PLM4]
MREPVRGCPAPLAWASSGLGSEAGFCADTDTLRWMRWGWGTKGCARGTRSRAVRSARERTYGMTVRPGVVGGAGG